MITVTAEMTLEELEALKLDGATSYQFHPDGADETITQNIKKLDGIVGMVGSLEFGKGIKNFEPIVEESEPPAPKKDKKTKELSPEEQAAKKAVEAERARRRQKLALIDSMLVPVGFEECPTREEYLEAKGDGAEIGLAEYKHNTEEIVSAVLKSGFESPKTLTEDDGTEVEESEDKMRFRIMKNIQARKFNLARADRVAGYQIRQREISASSISTAKIMAFMRDTELRNKLSDSDKAEIVQLLGK